MRAIVHGLNEREVVILFCMKLASFRKKWENPGITKMVVSIGFSSLNETIENVCS
jgi:hypothetical protein